MKYYSITLTLEKVEANCTYSNVRKSLSSKFFDLFTQRSYRYDL